MDQAGRAASRERSCRAVAGADRGDPRARARAHPPPRLPREPAADARRDAVVLPPRGLVAVAADSGRTRELLRRSRGEPVRGSVCVCDRARRSRGTARRHAAAGLPRHGRKRQLARPSRAPPAWRSDARRPCTRLARRQRDDCGDVRGRGRRGRHRPVPGVTAAINPAAGNVPESRGETGIASGSGCDHTGARSNRQGAGQRAQSQLGRRGAGRAPERSACRDGAGHAASDGCHRRAAAGHHRTVECAAGPGARDRGARADAAGTCARGRQPGAPRNHRDDCRALGALRSPVSRRADGALGLSVCRDRHAGAGGGTRDWRPAEQRQLLVVEQRRKARGEIPGRDRVHRRRHGREVAVAGRIAEDSVREPRQIARSTCSRFLVRRSEGRVHGRRVRHDYAPVLDRRDGEAIRSGRTPMGGEDAAAVHPADWNRRAYAREPHSQDQGGGGRAGRDFADRGELGEEGLLQRAAEDAPRPGGRAAGARAGGPRNRLGLRAGVAADGGRGQAAGRPGDAPGLPRCGADDPVRLRDAPCLFVGLETRSGLPGDPGRHPRRRAASTRTSNRRRFSSRSRSFNRSTARRAARSLRRSTRWAATSNTAGC